MPCKSHSKLYSQLVIRSLLGFQKTVWGTKSVWKKKQTERYRRPQIYRYVLTHFGEIFSFPWLGKGWHYEVEHWTFLFFDLGFMANQDYFVHFEPSQSLGWANMEIPWHEKLHDHLKAELVSCVTKARLKLTAVRWRASTDQIKYV